MVSQKKYPVKFVQREREEDKPTTKYELRLERGWYSDDGKELKGTITVETELIDDKEEAQELFDESRNGVLDGSLRQVSYRPRQ